MRRLTSREKVLVIATCIVIAGVAVVQLVILPALTSRQDSLAQLGKFDAVLGILDVLPAQPLDKKVVDVPPLRQRVTQSAGRANLEIRRLDPQGVASLSVSLDDVPFAALIGWLDNMTAQAQVRVLSAEIGRRPKPGIVSARLLLEAE